MLYKRIIKPILFRFDPEVVHDTAISMGELLGKTWMSRSILASLFSYRNKKLETKVAGISFKNPVGLAAGFDKDCRLVDVLPSIGFGFAELGSITAQPCRGNPPPRLARLPKDKSIIVYYGLKNKGAEAIAQTLYNKKFPFPVGLSIAKTNDPSIKGHASINDYIKSFRILHPIGSYTTLNISCPNTGDGTTFCNPLLLSKLLDALESEKINKPIFLKLSPDLDTSTIDSLLRITEKHPFITGFIVGNLTKERKNLKSTARELSKIPKGGLSGKPTGAKSNELLSYIYKKTNGSSVLVGCGGIFSAQDAYTKIKNGASLVQLVTSMIYKGPGVIKEINQGIVMALEKDGLSNIHQAVGTAARSDKTNR